MWRFLKVELFCSPLPYLFSIPVYSFPSALQTGPARHPYGDHILIFLQLLLSPPQCGKMAQKHHVGRVSAKERKGLVALTYFPLSETELASLSIIDRSTYQTKASSVLWGGWERKSPRASKAHGSSKRLCFCRLSLATSTSTLMARMVVDSPSLPRGRGSHLVYCFIL